MARYIDAEALLEELRSLQVTVTGIRVGKSYLSTIVREYQKSFLKIVHEQPTADVVPRSEVDLYRKQVDELEDELASTYDKLEKLEHILDCYALQYGTVTDQQKVIDKAKAEVAREIFEEIESISSDFPIYGNVNTVILGERDLAFIKKKYTEGKDEQASTRDPI